MSTVFDQSFLFGRSICCLEVYMYKYLYIYIWYCKLHDWDNHLPYPLLGFLLHVPILLLAISDNQVDISVTWLEWLHLDLLDRNKDSAFWLVFFLGGGDQKIRHTFFWQTWRTQYERSLFFWGRMWTYVNHVSARIFSIWVDRSMLLRLGKRKWWKGVLAETPVARALFLPMPLTQLLVGWFVYLGYFITFWG